MFVKLQLFFNQIFIGFYVIDVRSPFINDFTWTAQNDLVNDLFSFRWVKKSRKMFIFSRPYQRQWVALTPGEILTFHVQSSNGDSLNNFSAYLNMVCGGMFLSYGVFNILAGHQKWTIGMSTAALFFVPASFHITMILGVIVSSLVYYRIEIINIHVSDFLGGSWIMS